MKCQQCGHETSGKFCGKCGVEVEQTSATSKKFCGKCGAEVNLAKKFCGQCGAPSSQTSPDPDPVKTSAEITNKSCIYWDIRPELVAQRLEESQMDHYGIAKGIIIHEGTRALIYSAGEFAGEFTSGKYTLLTSTKKGEPEKGEPEKTIRVGGILGKFKAGAKKVWSFLVGEKTTEEKAAKKEAQKKQEKEQQKAFASQRDMSVDDFIKIAEQGKPFTIVLARDGEFNLVFNYTELDTAEVRSDVSLQLRVKITDLRKFYKHYLHDHLSVTMSRLQKDLAGIVDLEVANLIKGMKIDDIGRNRDLLDQLASAINQELERTMGFVTVTRVFKATAKREEIELLRQMAEELYLADKELAQRINVDEFQHRVRLADNASEIMEFKDAQALDVEMKKLNKDKLLSDEDFDRFKKRLQLDSLLADAKDQEEKESTLVEYENNGVIRQSDAKLLREQTEMSRGHTLELLDISNRIEKDSARLKWEHEIGDEQIQLEVDRRRKLLISEAEFMDLEGVVHAKQTDLEIEDRTKRDDYSDTRRDRDREHETKDFDEQSRQLELAEKLRREGEKEEHERDMEITRMANEAKLKKRELTKEMSAEQILAEQGKQSETEAARARADAEIAARDDRGKAADEKVAMADKLMDRMERMAEKSMESTAAVAGAQATQKDEQLKREEDRSKETTEAVTGVVGSSASAVGEGIKGKSQSMNKCVNPECGAAIEGGADFCTDCGTKQS
jgi:hypothetical protein